MKFLFLTSHAPSLIGFRKKIIISLVSSGIEVFAAAPNFDENTRKALKSIGAQPIDCSMDRVGLNPIKEVINTLKLSILIRDINPDVFIGYFVKPVIFGSIAARMAGVNNIFSMVEGLGYAFTEDGRASSVKKIFLKKTLNFLYSLAFKFSRRVVFLNPDDARQLVNAGLLKKNKAFLLGGIGVDLEKWRKSSPVIDNVKFILIARLLREKGIFEYVEAARIVKNKYKNTRFILLGGLDENPGAIQLSEVEGWVNEGFIEWYGHVSVEQWLHESSIFVLPSYREGVPVSTQEAMAVGRAVITTDVPGCRETVIDGVNGFLIPPRNVEQLVEKMCIFIENPDLVIAMGKASRQIAEERFDVEEVNERLLGMIFDEMKVK